MEDFVRDSVLPCYGNTHTLTTSTARHTTYLRAEAREVIRHHLNASHEDAVIFAGNGSTGAAHLLVEALHRAQFDVLGGLGAQGARRDMHYREDRWGSGECTLCGIRVKNSSVYQAHQYCEGHRERLKDVETVVSKPPGRRVLALVDPVAHHSTSLPFRELLPLYPLASPPVLGPSFAGSTWRSMEEPSDADAGAGVAPKSLEFELCNVPLDTKTGLLDEDELRKRLEIARAWRDPRELVVICVLAAASNVTGLSVDVPRVTAAARAALPGVVVCWDFAAAAGHTTCNLNPPGNEAATVDAAFFSPHKLWGGPGSVGVLAVKKRLLCNAVPATPGGGVVFYVSEDGHSYIQNSEEREEAGTPNIVGSIRAGLAFHLYDQIPSGAAKAREHSMRCRVLKAWGAHPRIDILGPVVDEETSHTGVVSFMIRYGNASPGLYLHYQFVSALLNDLFGVQARGGCACAGPYAQWLLGVSPEQSAEFETCLRKTAQEVLRPGFVRIGVHWAMSDEDLEVLIAAVLWVADRGWRLLAAYTFDRETGEWLHRLDTPEKRRVWLSSVRPELQVQQSSIPKLEEELQIAPGASLLRSAPRGAAALITAADAALQAAYSSAQVALSSSKWPILDPAYARLLWFALPTDVAATLQSAQPDKPKLVEAVFEGEGARPEHSVLDGRLARVGGQVDGAFEVEAIAQGDLEMEWAPEDDEDSVNVAPLADGEFVFPRRVLHPSVPKTLRGLVGKAIADFGMIKDGDKLLVGLSGGKDSLTVLHVLLALQKSAPIRFEIAAATVDPETPEFNPHPLTAYLKAMGVQYHMLSKPIIEMAKVHLDPKRPSLCAFCSRMKRGMLYSCMREHGYTNLVLGQHLDDFAESFFMSAIHNGLLRTMKAHYWVQQEDVRVCRPLLYVRESATAMFAKENQLPIISDNCPACFAAPKERHKTKLLLSSLEFDYPQLFSTLLRTMRPLFALNTAQKDGESSHLHAASPAEASKVVEEDFESEMVLTSCGVRGDDVCPVPVANAEAPIVVEDACVPRVAETNHPRAPQSVWVPTGTGFALGLLLGAVAMRLVGQRR